MFHTHFFSIGRVFTSDSEAIKLTGGYTTKCMSHSQNDTWPILFIFLAAWLHCLVIGIKLHCLVTEAHVC